MLYHVYVYIYIYTHTYMYIYVMYTPLDLLHQQLHHLDLGEVLGYIYIYIERERGRER